jgi:mono/diheme cytochrome c family protein
VGAPSNYDLSDTPAVEKMLAQLDTLPELSFGEKLYAQFGVPWRPDDVHAAWRTMSLDEVAGAMSGDSGEPPGTMFARVNGSPLYKTRMADLRGVRDRRWLDATGTHRNRGPEDLARYGILVEYAPEPFFGPHQMYPESALKYLVRPPDEAMYALGLYLYSLDPAPSPYPFDDTARRGQELFEEEGCVKCHTPPAYTNNKLVPVPGFDPPLDDPRVLAGEVSERRVHTDPGLALKTRKGTGYYKVPSLRGLWYRGLYGHSGFETSLEAWFDPSRQRADHVPSGWRGPGVATLAVPGHDFGLDLEPAEKTALIAFLRTL